MTRSKKRVIQEAEHYRSKGYAAGLAAARKEGSVAAGWIWKEMARSQADVTMKVTWYLDMAREYPRTFEVHDIDQPHRLCLGDDPCICVPLRAAEQVVAFDRVGAHVTGYQEGYEHGVAQGRMEAFLEAADEVAALSARLDGLRVESEESKESEGPKESGESEDADHDAPLAYSDARGSDPAGQHVVRRPAGTGP